MRSNVENGKVVIRHGVETIHLEPLAAHAFALDLLKLVSQADGASPAPEAASDEAPETERNAA